MASIASAEMERVMVARSREARGSSESVSGRLDVRGEAAPLDPSAELDVVGIVMAIVGGLLLPLLLSPSDCEEETVR